MASSALTPNKPYYQNMIKRSHNTLQFLIYLALLLFPFPISAALHGRCLIASTSQHPVLSNATQLHLHCFTQWTLTIFSLGLTLPNIDGYYNDELTTDEEFITFTFFYLSCFQNHHRWSYQDWTKFTAGSVWSCSWDKELLCILLS